jgi:hypothetical protein
MRPLTFAVTCAVDAPNEAIWDVIGDFGTEHRHPRASVRRGPGTPSKGKAVALPDHDLTRLNQLKPHAVYAWMSWVQILSPSRARFESLRPLLAESLASQVESRAIA